MPSALGLGQQTESFTQVKERVAAPLLFPSFSPQIKKIARNPQSIDGSQCLEGGMQMCEFNNIH